MRQVSSTSSTIPSRPLGADGRTVLGTYLVLVSVLLAYLVYDIWPEETQGATSQTAATVNPGGAGFTPGQNEDNNASLFGIQLTISREVELILMVMVLGALGGNVHALRSFASFAGNRSLMSSWVWWCLFRPFVGVPLALIVYFLVRGGIVSAGIEAEDIRPYSIAAISALVGMFSDQATAFLRRTFRVLFPPGEEEEIGDRISS